MRILSIQSSVAYGYAGNSAATFPLQRLGHEVWAVNTVHFSNHTGYGSFRGIVFEPAVVADVIRGIADRGVLGSADVVLTGYQGSPGVADVVLDAVARVKAANPRAVYCCDPVMGDLGKGMFVLPELPELIRTRVVPAADVVTPNAFELAYLAGTGGDPEVAVPADVRTVEGVLAAVDRVRAMGPRTVLVTSLDDAWTIAPVPGGSHGAGDTGEFFGLTAGGGRSAHAEDPDSAGNDGDDDVLGSARTRASTQTLTPATTRTADAHGTIGMIAVDDSGAYQVRTPRLPLLANGAGDVTAALFVAHLLEDGIERALAATASSVYGILAETIRRATSEQRARGGKPGAAGTDVEIALVEAQEAIAHPRCEFEVTRLR
ncbi:MAG: pyridoxal kinase [Actinobacteria bacterium]|nr:pyridoxal kinase [Actinomycetota bacterium]